MLTWDTPGDYWDTGYLIDRRQARELDPETPGKDTGVEYRVKDATRVTRTHVDLR